MDTPPPAEGLHERHSRIASLDGWRAIAIGFVLPAHIVGTRGHPQMAASVSAFIETTGRLGVLIFFVISGFLITTLLMREKDETNAISLKHFYARRALRILPAAYAYMLAMAVATWLGWIEIKGYDFAAALTYLTNYNAHRGWYLGHLWSLSIEEQFYLLWPFALAWAGRKAGATFAIAAFLLAPVVRLVMHVALPLGPYRDLEIFPAVADGIAAGCLMALARPALLQQAWYLRLTRHGALWLVLPAAVIVHWYTDYTVVNVLGMPLLLMALALLIEASTRRTGVLSGRILNAAPMVWLGTLSYSLYLWQQPFLNRQAGGDEAAFPLNIALAFVAAIASYVLIERPFLRLRSRFSAHPQHPRGGDSTISSSAGDAAREIE